ncbi:hypothetical protein [Sediminibacterium sp.]|uniref:hypothetical protein n=1 Tax=Sediminibacterium sp. TaxID=1917865 RepID=UPI0027360291|nr:hypothetical protein [Sediminibacterium sp.]MDP3394323.1 hypothetical protein [Sediminibacterium sp.]MDP3568158.1 hypothetical protein [Sediminibacterium sp.]
MQKTFFTFCMFFLSMAFTHAQTIIQAGNFQSISLHGPLMYYWNNPTIAFQFTQDLQQQLLTKKGYSLDGNNISFSILKNIKEFSAASNSSTTFPVINMKLAEYPASLYLQQFYPDQLNDSSQQGIQSVILVEISIQQNGNAELFSRSLEVFIKKSNAIGFGVPFNNLHLSAKGFSELMKKSVEIILDSNNLNEQIELKASPPSMGDNFIIGAITNMPKIAIESKGLFSKYALNGKTELIRWDEQRYLEIILRGKNKTVLQPALNSIIVEKEKENPQAVFVFLLQEARNIVLNRNYQLVIPARISGNNNSRISNMPIVEPLEGNNNFMLQEKDTIAYFSIETDQLDSTKKIYPYLSSNGIDSNSLTRINDFSNAINFTSLYYLKGKIRNQAFSIEVGEFFRIIYLNNERIVLLSGMQQPERMVIFNPNISIELINELILLSYNRFFQ